jgi:hypothetical protein
MSEPPSAAPAASAERRLHSSQLPGLIAGLQQALARQGVAPDNSAALMAASVSARCVACGIESRGDELLQLVVADPAAPPSPKLERLRQGYCARTGCNSYFVNLSLQPSAEADWGRLLAEAESSPASHGGESAAARPARWPRQKLIRIAVGIALVLVAIIIRQLVTHRPIPFIYEPERFKADPNSLPEDPMSAPQRR